MSHTSMVQADILFRFEDFVAYIWPRNRTLKEDSELSQGRSQATPCRNVSCELLGSNAPQYLRGAVSLNADRISAPQLAWHRKSRWRCMSHEKSRSVKLPLRVAILDGLNSASFSSLPHVQLKLGPLYGTFACGCETQARDGTGGRYDVKMFHARWW